eukprot:5207149-Amphidinium_carterae.6
MHREEHHHSIYCCVCGLEVRWARSGEPIHDSQRDSRSVAGYEPKGGSIVGVHGGLQSIPIHTPRARKKSMGEKEDEQALKLNETMDEFSSTASPS